MSHEEMPKAYEGAEIENKWYKYWEEKKKFSGGHSPEKEPYCIVIPPPNVTGVLHMGHALVNALQDILIRWKRMQGFDALWIPGTDHAGIATQTVVERHLIKTEGKRRKDYKREEFLKHVWDKKEDSETRIQDQLKRLGCSCDWDRKRFTMDGGCNNAVRTVFKKMYDEGLIYRGDYLVNWDPVTQTALADDEVEYEEREGQLWHFRYPYSDGSGHAIIATTRPETMLGDTAVAVSPSDERYKDLIGKEIMLPLTDRSIPIIADHHVDPEFGSGMVKVTPAHDPNDYEIGIRHDLPFINIMTPDAHINENGGRFVGLSMKEARVAVVEAMKEQGFLEKIIKHPHRVGISYRSKATIEPYMSKQWFVKMDSFKAPLKAAVEEGKCQLTPKVWDRSYAHWINKLRDWCISRQLWWGHRIPIWYRKEDRETMICYAGEGLPPEVEAEPDAWIQDEDVLDTWFSSALWPFSTLGWPEKTPEFERFYPNAVLVTGHDILFFWVARMLLMGEYVTGQLPFPETFLHGLIYGKSYWRNNDHGGITYVADEERLEYDMGKPVPSDVTAHWEKMSKSKGNIIDPLEIIDEYGCDAMRMALCFSATQAQQIDLDRRRFEDFKNFANKLWNGARFVMMNLEGVHLGEGLNEDLLQLEDRWLLSRLNTVSAEVNKALSTYSFDQAASKAYEFFWKEFCAYYVEIAKPVLFDKIGTAEEKQNKQKLLVIALCTAIRLLHPMAPFITEELFFRLKDQIGPIDAKDSIDPYSKECIDTVNGPDCITAPYPQEIRASDRCCKIEEGFSLMSRLIYSIRNIRGEMKLPPNVSVDVYIVGKTKDEDFSFAEKNQNIVSALIRTKTMNFLQEEPELDFSSTSVVDSLKILIPLPKELIEKEKERLVKEATKLELTIERIEKQLQNEAFVSKAPQALVDKQRQQAEEAQMQLSEIKSKIQMSSC
jgi:valyl-tRNA synthetase